MPAKRPETRTGSRNAAPGGTAIVAAAAWVLGGACLILNAAPSVSRAETVANPKPAAASASKPAASQSPRSAPDSTIRAPGSAGTAVATPSTSSTGTAKRETPATSVVTQPPAAKPAGGTAAVRTRTAKGSPPPAGSRPATVPTVRSARGSAPLAGATPGQLVPSGTTGARGVQAVAHLDQKLTYQYNALGRRDPFQPMIGGEFVGADVGGDAPVDVGGMKVVGIVWGTEDKFAMAEDGRGQSLVLRVGDKVMNGVVSGLRRDAVVVRITTDGTTQSVAIPLTRKGDKSNATR